MKDYSNHPYKKLLSYIEERCQRLNEKRDYVGYLLSMECAKSIEELIKIYNLIYKLLAVLILQSYILPKNWYNIKSLGIGNAYLFEDLNRFFNEHLLRLFKTASQPTQEERLSFIVNLRACDNTQDMLNQMLEDSNTDFRNEYGFVIAKILVYPRLKKEIEQYYRLSENASIMKEYKDCYKVFAAHHRLLDVAENLFWKEYGLDCDGLIAEYIKDLKEQKEKANQRESEKKKTNRQDSLSMLTSQLNGAADALLAGALSIPLGFVGALFSICRKGKI